LLILQIFDQVSALRSNTTDAVSTTREQWIFQQERFA